MIEAGKQYVSVGSIDQMWHIHGKTLQGFWIAESVASGDVRLLDTDGVNMAFGIRLVHKTKRLLNNDEMEALVGKKVRGINTGAVCLVSRYLEGRVTIHGSQYDAKSLAASFVGVDCSLMVEE